MTTIRAYNPIKIEQYVNNSSYNMPF